MANLVYERPTKERPWSNQWARYYLKPFEAVYGIVPGNLAIPDRRHWPEYTNRTVGYCEPDAPVASQRAKDHPEHKKLMLQCNGCYEGRTGSFCEQPKRMYCLRDCCGHGTCDAGFCWCQPGWYGIDCSLTLSHLSNGTPHATARHSGLGSVLATNPSSQVHASSSQPVASISPPKQVSGTRQLSVLPVIILLLLLMHVPPS